MELPTLVYMGERALAEEAHFNIVHKTHSKGKRRFFKSLYAAQRVQGLGKDLVRPELHSHWRYSTYLRYDSSNVKSEELFCLPSISQQKQKS